MPKKWSQNKKFNNPSTEGKRLIDSYNLHNFPDCPPDSPSFVYTRVLSGGLSGGLSEKFDMSNSADSPPDSPSFVYTRVLSGGLSAGLSAGQYPRVKATLVAIENVSRIDEALNTIILSKCGLNFILKPFDQCETHRVEEIISNVCLPSQKIMDDWNKTW
jgi:hypothetical protein